MRPGAPCCLELLVDGLCNQFRITAAIHNSFRIHTLLCSRHQLQCKVQQSSTWSGLHIQCALRRQCTSRRRIVRTLSSAVCPALRQDLPAVRKVLRLCSRQRVCLRLRPQAQVAAFHTKVLQRLWVPRGMALHVSMQTPQRCCSPSISSCVRAPADLLGPRRGGGRGPLMGIRRPRLPRPRLVHGRREQDLELAVHDEHGGRDVAAATAGLGERHQVRRPWPEPQPAADRRPAPASELDGDAFHGNTVIAVQGSGAHAKQLPAQACRLQQVMHTKTAGSTSVRDSTALQPHGVSVADLKVLL